jgi:parvulin-like peptidyl-prolyl isomerase
MLPPKLLRFLGLLLVLLTMGAAQATDTLATVNGDPISVTMFQQRVRFSRWTSAQQLIQIKQSYGDKMLTDPASPFNSQYVILTVPSAFGKQVLDALIAVKLVRQEAARRGIAITDADVQQQIYAFFGYTPDATPMPAVHGQTPQTMPDPTELADAFATNRDNYFGQAGVAAKMAQSDIIETFAEQALQVKLYNALTGDVPPQAEQIHVRHILVYTEDKANELLAQIKAGASFTELATANSIDTGSAPQGGDLGWASKDVYVPEFETAIWAAQPGQVIGPIKTAFGYHLVLIEGRAVRALSLADLARARESAYKTWLQKARSSATIGIVDNWQTFIPSDPTLAELGLPDVK